MLGLASASFDAFQGSLEEPCTGVLTEPGSYNTSSGRLSPPISRA